MNVFSVTFFRKWRQNQSRHIDELLQFKSMDQRIWLIGCSKNIGTGKANGSDDMFLKCFERYKIAISNTTFQIEGSRNRLSRSQIEDSLKETGFLIEDANTVKDARVIKKITTASDLRMVHC